MEPTLQTTHQLHADDEGRPGSSEVHDGHPGLGPFLRDETATAHGHGGHVPPAPLQHSDGGPGHSCPGLGLDLASGIPTLPPSHDKWAQTREREDRWAPVPFPGGRSRAASHPRPRMASCGRPPGGPGPRLPATHLGVLVAVEALLDLILIHVTECDHLERIWKPALRTVLWGRGRRGDGGPGDRVGDGGCAAPWPVPPASGCGRGGGPVGRRSRW